VAEDSFEQPKFSSRVINRRAIDISTWPTPDEGALNGNARLQYFSRKSAVKAYLLGTPAAQIKQLTGISSKQAYRLIRERCLESHEDGQPYGFRALIPYLHIQPYKRHKKIATDHFGKGGVGAFEAVLDLHPDLRLEFDKRIASIPNGKKLAETKIGFTRHCNWFLDELRRRGFEQRGEWPFNTASTAYYSVRRYVKKILASNPRALAERAGGPDLVRKMKAGDGSDRPALKFMDRVEMDAHKLDGRFCVSIPQIGGGSIERIVHRLWVIVIVEVVSRAVLGYYFSTGKEVSSDDVLRTIKCALSRWRPKALSFAKEPYANGAGLLSSLGDDFVALCWNETSVDGALAETCKRIKGALKDTAGSVLLTPENSYSVRRSLDDRPFIETFFRNLAGKGFQRLSNTTGGKSSDRKGRNPEDIAITSRFQYEYAEELLDVLIANYNLRPHTGIGRRTPLAYAKLLADQADTPLRHTELTTIESILSVRKLCRVRGGAKVGRHVFAEFFYAEYTNEILQNRQDLVGKKIWITNHKEDDGRVALASTAEGTSLGVVRAAPPWHLSPHSLRLRCAIKQAEARGKFVVPHGGDAIEEFVTFVETQPQGKLPVHPMYLEARRILSAAASAFIGESLLEAARARAKAESVAQRDSTSNPINQQNQVESHPVSAAAPHKVKVAAKAPTLPPRRIAATKG